MRKTLLTLLVLISPFFFLAAPSHAAEEFCRINGIVTRRPNGNFNLGVSVNTTQLDPGTSYTITLDTGIRDSVNHAFNPPPEHNGVNYAFELDTGHTGNTYTLYVRPTSCTDVAGTGCAIQQCSTRISFPANAPLTSDDPTGDEVLPLNAPEPLPELESYRFCQQIPSGTQRTACEACVGDNEGEVGRKIYTAVGCINVSGSGLAGDLIRLFLGIAGGTALLSIVFAGATFALSQGDTNKVKTAKELMTAAVSGLLFIIFSVIILNFVGVEIFRIPGLR